MFIYYFRLHKSVLKPLSSFRLEEQHKNELEAYKGECEKWRSEVKTLQLYINAYKKDFVDLRPNIEKELKDKDNKIHELLITMRQLKVCLMTWVVMKLFFVSFLFYLDGIAQKIKQSTRYKRTQ